jgi:hypothetical protein
VLASESTYVSGTFWASIGLAALALATIVVTVYLWRRGGPPRLIVYGAPIVTSLLSSHAPQNDQIFVSFRRPEGSPRELRNPYLVKLRIESRSRKDIRREDFDDGEPLVFRLNTNFASQIGEPAARAQGVKIDVRKGEISIGPGLIKKGLILAAEFVTDGRPHVSWVGQLADVQVRETADDSDWSAWLIIGTLWPSWCSGSTRS